MNYVDKQTVLPLSHVSFLGLWNCHVALLPYLYFISYPTQYISSRLFYSISYTVQRLYYANKSKNHLFSQTSSLKLPFPVYELVPGKELAILHTGWLEALAVWHVGNVDRKKGEPASFQMLTMDAMMVWAKWNYHWHPLPNEEFSLWWKTTWFKGVMFKRPVKQPSQPSLSTQQHQIKTGDL